MGNSTRDSFQPPGTPVHPHSRGEQEERSPNLLSESGSSPLAWGTAIVVIRVPPFLRFIPTRVGNRYRYRIHNEWNPVHPHSRGEQQVARLHHAAAAGSSPLAWGTGRAVGDAGGRVRFIPTRVGNRRGRRSSRPSPTVHPHSRGEQTLAPTRSLMGSGSSPLAWGTVSHALPPLRQVRFIPTRVGNSSACIER